MRALNSITLTQFKNYSHRQFQFPERVVGICGRNGTGKTNLLDAIHYLCFTKSYFSRLDSVNVQKGAAGFRIEARMQWSDHSEKLVCILRETGKKEFYLDDVPYERFAEHIGRYPCVIIAPDDMQIITGPGEERRRFLDALLSQLDPAYLKNLILYHRLLQQRNALLKQLGETNTGDRTVLDVLDEQLVEPANMISRVRHEFLELFLHRVKNSYSFIAAGPEAVELEYLSSIGSASFRDILAANRQRDLAAWRTTSGIHKDELLFTLDGLPFRNHASQGQRKSLLFALKLAEMDVLEEAKGFPPLLLLDDVFEKLDDERIHRLLEKVCVKNQGQVFITDTSESRLSGYLSQLGVKHSIHSPL